MECERGRGVSFRFPEGLSAELEMVGTCFRGFVCSLGLMVNLGGTILGPTEGVVEDEATVSIAYNASTTFSPFLALPFSTLYFTRRRYAPSFLPGLPLCLFDMLRR
jgi:hypothetical protein